MVTWKGKKGEGEGKGQGPKATSSMVNKAECLEAGVGAKFLKPTQYQQLRVQDVVKPVRR